MQLVHAATCRRLVHLLPVFGHPFDARPAALSFPPSPGVTRWRR